MDNLVLIRVAGVLHRSLAGCPLRELRQDAPHLYRLIFERQTRPLSVIVSLEPTGPWIGRPAGRGPSARRPPGPFAGLIRRQLRGGIVAGVTKGADRKLTLRFMDGKALVAELVPHRANLILLDEGGRVEACARKGRADRDRLATGARYVAPDLPQGRLDPVSATAREIDDRIARDAEDGAGAAEALTRGVFGISKETARILLEESRETGRTPGEVLAARVGALTEGNLDPVLEGPRGAEAKDEGLTGDPADWTLLPWEPLVPPDPSRIRFRKEDPAATAGFYHGLLELHRSSRERSRALLRILSAEVDRQRRSLTRIAADLTNFEDPARFRIWGEALLAGLQQARRSGAHVLVPDPYDPDQKLLSVPVPGDRTPQQAAQDLFHRFRRATRGLEQARERAAATERRRRRLEQLRAQYEGAVDAEALSGLAAEMRALGIAVELEPPGSRRAPKKPTRRPRLEGVRLLTSVGGRTLLVGKGGRENDRLTFKLAGPEDFWFHARGVPGAHVVLRNEARERRPPEDLLREAAAVAAWYSESPRDGEVDVQWTRRKYVRRLKGARPGTVTVKKSETIRVRPGLPPDSEAVDRP